MARQRKRRKWPIIAALLAFALGVGCIAYPYVSDWVHKQSQAQTIHRQFDAVQNSDKGKLADQFQQAQQYNVLLLKNRTVLTDPFDPNNQPVTSQQYEGLLNLAGDGVMGTLYIPKVKLQIPIYHGTSDDVLQKGVGHMEGTSLPVGGDNTHAVLAGHNGLPSVRIFDDIDKLKVGDFFVVQVLGEDHAYGITSTEVVLPDETNSLVATPGKDQVTLVTCTPYGVNTHRLLVHAERIDVPSEWLDRNNADTSLTPYVVTRNIPIWLFSLAGVAIAIGVAFIILLVKKKRGNDDDDLDY